VKQSNADRSVSNARDPAPTAGRLPPRMGRWGMRGMEDFTVEELARLHQQLGDWIRQRAHDPARPRHRPWVRHPHMHTAHPADRREST
jgi:hypothetical protein